MCVCPTEAVADLVPVTDADDDEDGKERFCDSLIMCIVTTLNEGLRNGGGIGDSLRKPSRTVSGRALIANNNTLSNCLQLCGSRLCQATYYKPFYRCSC